MRLRSLLFVPGDRAERFAKAAASGADAIILDLEDSVSPANKEAAREAVAAYLAGTREVFTLVRVNPLDGHMTAADVAAIVGGRPDAIMLPKAEGAPSIAQLDTILRSEGAADASLPPVLPIATETPAAIFTLGSYREAKARLVGLTWGAEDLPIKDEAGLAAYAARARRDGFTGMMAIHPSQVAPINAAFTPSADEVQRAQAIVDAFAANPGSGVLQVDGKMVDAPHLKQARHILSLAD